jgi:arsenite-transporting ATPase
MVRETTPGRKVPAANPVVISGVVVNFLHNPPRYLFFAGKGGVGKTSLSCATAIHLANQGKQPLLVSTDPASNIGQVFGQTIGNVITPIHDVPGLRALEIDPQGAAQLYRDRLVTPVRGVLPDNVVKAMEEQLSGACTTEIAAFDEFTGLLTDPTHTEAYDHIVFDTAPTGHTIRLLQLPGAWSSFLEAGKGDASCLGPLSGLAKQRERYSAAVRALADPERTRLVLVSRAQTSALNEVARTRDELAAIGLQRQHLVINGVMPASEAPLDPLASAIHQREQAAIAAMPAVLRNLPSDRVSLKPMNIVGVEALEQFFDNSASPAEMARTPGPDIDAPTLSSLVDEIAEDGRGLVMLMGKGGVGKTTIAAAVAVELTRRGFPVHLSTSDPAAHLSDTLADTSGDLEVSRIDPRAETERYREHVLKTKGANLDDERRAMLEEDLRSPCTEEIAVFQAFSHLIREADRKFVVMDTAPTGHTLLLLDATGAYHREVARHMSGRSRFTTPMMRLQDQSRTKVMIVTLPETTPVLEAAGLQNDLRRAGIEPWAWIINASLAVADTRSSLLRQRAQHEVPQLELVREGLADRVALVPMQRREPIGMEGLWALLSGDAGTEMSGGTRSTALLIR